jgi:hypothetical protein
MSTNRPPSCDLPPEFYQTKPMLKPCPFCDSHSVEMRDGYNMDELNVYVHCNNCEADGPWVDTDAGGQWNATPRRSEVMELLNKLEFLMIASDWNRQDELEDLQRCADKLRKEMEE